MTHSRNQTWALQKVRITKGSTQRREKSSSKSLHGGESGTDRFFLPLTPTSQGSQCQICGVTSPMAAVSFGRRVLSVHVARVLRRTDLLLTTRRPPRPGQLMKTGGEKRDMWVSECKWQAVRGDSTWNSFLFQRNNSSNFRSFGNLVRPVFVGSDPSFQVGLTAKRYIHVGLKAQLNFSWERKNDFALKAINKRKLTPLFENWL